MTHRVWHKHLIKRSLAILSMFALLVVISACGATPTATPQPAAVAKNLIVVTDTVLGSTNVPADMKTDRSCVQTNRFPKNGQIVWRTRIYDPKTGDLMDDKAISGIEVKLSNGTAIAAKYGAHPKGSTEFFWTASWIVPPTSPTGTLSYTLTATGTDGRTGQFTPLTVATSLMTITDEVFKVVATPVPATSPAPSK